MILFQGNVIKLFLRLAGLISQATVTVRATSSLQTTSARLETSRQPSHFWSSRRGRGSLDY